MTPQEKAAGVVATPATANSKSRSRKFPTIRRFLKASIDAVAAREWRQWPITQWSIELGGFVRV